MIVAVVLMFNILLLIMKLLPKFPKKEPLKCPSAMSRCI
jgi:hypothetical protein